MDMSLSKLQELVMDREYWFVCSPWGHKELDTTEQLNWTDEACTLKVALHLFMALLYNKREYNTIIVCKWV